MLCGNSDTLHRVNVALTYDSEKNDVIRYLLLGQNDDEIAMITGEIDRQGKALFGKTFSLRFDRAVKSKNVRLRTFISSPGLPCRR